MRQGRSPGHTFTLPLFALKCYFLLGKQGETADIDMIVEKAVNDSWVNNQQCFSDRADMTSMAITWLPKVTWPASVALLQPTILQACVKYLMVKATTTELGTSWTNGFIASTDYVCINFSEAAVIQPEIATLLPGVKKYLLIRQHKRGFWQRSDGERSPIVQSKEYYTAVTLRALFNIDKTNHKSLNLHFWSGQAEKYWRFSIALNRLATTLAGVALSYCLFTLLKAFGPGYFASPLAARYESLILGLLGTFSFFQVLYVSIIKRTK